MEELIKAAQALLDWQAGVGEDGYALEDMDVLPSLIEDLAEALKDDCACGRPSGWYKRTET